MLIKRQPQVHPESHVLHPYLQKASLKVNLMTPWTQLCLLQTMPMLMLTGFPIHFLTVIWRGDLRQIITTITITDQEIIVKAKRGKIFKNLLLHYFILGSTVAIR